MLHRRTTTFLLAFSLICGAIFPLFAASSETLAQGEHLLNEGCFEAALEHYEKLLKDLQTLSHDKEKDKRETTIRYQIAFCAYHLGFLDQAIDVLSRLKTKNPETLYLQALALKALGEYTQAAIILDEHLQAIESHKEFDPNIYLERAEIAYLLGDYETGIRLIETIQMHSSQNMTLQQTNLCLAKIKIAQNKTPEAKALFENIIASTTSKTPPFYEAHFHLGEIHFDLGELQLAENHFQASVRLRPISSIPWYKESLYRLALTHKRQSELATDKQIKKQHSKMATQTLEQLIEFQPSERALLALAETLLNDGLVTQNSDTLNKVETLLASSPQILSREGLCLSLFLRSKASKNYAHKDSLLRELTQEANIKSEVYWTGWKERCLNHMQTGILLEKTRKEEALSLFSLAAQDAHDYFELSRELSPLHAEQAQFLEAKSLLLQGLEPSCQKSYAISNELLKNPSIQHKSDLLFLHGQAAYILSKQDIAIHSWQECLKNDPNSKAVQEALFSLAALYIEKKAYKEGENCLLSFAKNFPDSNYAGDALYFASQCLEALHKPMKEIQSLRKQVFDQYPDSSFAAEAFFTYYPYSQYLQQNAKTMTHLRQSVKKYPNTVWSIYGYYLIGMQAMKQELLHKDEETPSNTYLRQAIESFHTLETTFDKLWKTDSIPKEHLSKALSIRVSATLERANANLLIASRTQGAKRRIYAEYAADLFEQLTNQWKNPSPPFSMLSKSAQSFTIDESHLGLAKALHFSNEKEKAAVILNGLIQKSKLEKTTRSWALAKAWYMLGQIAYDNHDIETAISALKKAKESAKGDLLGADEWLDVQIAESKCYRELGNLGEAMRILSAVVNERVVSQRRLQAMYIRAEIYEQQKRFNLSKRQLEALSRKGGKWATLAQKKLDKEYSYEPIHNNF